MNLSRAARIGTLAVAVGLLLAVAIVVLAQRDKHVTLFFDRTTGLYVGDEVRILGVVVGSVDAVTPMGPQVRVDASYDRDQPVPADARAAVVAPALVTGRYIQLAPAYVGGPELEDGAVIERERTAAPVEFDEIKRELDDLSVALGPNGVNRSGALNDLVTAGSRALDGRGQTLNDTTANLARAITTLSDGREDLADTVRNLQVLVSALAANDQSVDEFGGRLASVSSFLANNRDQLGRTLASLNTAVGDLRGFVGENRERLTGDVARLTDVSQNLVDQQANVAGLLHALLTTISNFYNIYNPTTNTADGQPVLNYTQSPGNFVCGLLASVNAPEDSCRTALGPLLQLAQLDYPPVGANPLTQPGSTNQAPPGSTGAAQSQAPDALPDLLLPQGDR